jgi:hypothetical protein
MMKLRQTIVKMAGLFGWIVLSLCFAPFQLNREQDLSGSTLNLWLQAEIISDEHIWLTLPGVRIRVIRWLGYGLQLMMLLGTLGVLSYSHLRPAISV